MCAVIYVHILLALYYSCLGIGRLAEKPP